MTDRPKADNVNMEEVNRYLVLSVSDFDFKKKYGIGYGMSVIRPYISVCQVVRGNL